MKEKRKNHARLLFDSRSVNETFARAAVTAFVAPTDPTVAELSDIKTAVSEAVTNCIVHAYKDSSGEILVDLSLYEDGMLRIAVTDHGCGIPDVAAAMTPLFTTGDPAERSGLGFSVMQSFMDRLHVTSRVGYGTRVIMTKQIHSRT